MKEPEKTIPITGYNAPQDHFVEVEVIGQVDRYSIIERLGSGAFGEVFLAYDTVAQIQVALKGLPREATRINEILERTRRNFTIVSRLSHPNIVTVRHLHKAEAVDEDADELLNICQGDYVLVMDYVNGETLGQLLARYPTRRVPPAYAISICRQVAAALDYAHSCNVIHRDIKPGNVMIDKTANVRVLDFGLAADVRESAANLSQELSRVCGTRRYMAPEQWEGELQGPATDQYALAILFYELVNGSVPHAEVFESTDHDYMYEAVMTRRIPRLGRISRQQNQVLFRALEHDPAKRYSSCAGFIEALANAEPDFRLGRVLFALASGALLALAVGFAMASVLAPDLMSGLTQAYMPSTEKDSKQPKRAEIPDELIESRSRAAVSLEMLDKIDPGQGMEHKVLALRQLTKAAEGYEANERFAKAGERYRLFFEGCREVEQLEQERGLARSAKIGMDGARKRAQDAESQVFAKHLWEEAVEDAANANATFERGEFEKAKNGFDEATNAFERTLKRANDHRDASTAQKAWTKCSRDLDLGELKKFGGEEWDALELIVSVAEKELEDGLYEDAVKSFAKAQKKLPNVIAATNRHRLAYDRHQRLTREISAFDEKIKSIQQGANLSLTKRRQQLTLLYHDLKELEEADTTPKDLSEQLNALLKTAKHELKSLNSGPQKLFSWKVDVTETAPMEFAYVPGGIFFLGSTDDEKAVVRKLTGREPTNEGDQPRLVKIRKGFWAARTETTVAHFRAFVEATKYKTTAEIVGFGTVQDPIDSKWQNQAGFNWKNPGYPYKVQPDFPVTFVSWQDAVAFCEWLTKRERKADRLPSNLEYRLPTEAEWEYACRTAPKTRTMFWWGDKYEDAVNLANVRDQTPLDKDENLVWKNSAKWKDGWSHVASVDYFGKKGRNAFELADMAGNVAEWVLNGYEDKEAPEVYILSEAKQRPVRGGSFLSLPIELRSAARVGMDATSARQDLGFRIVCAAILSPEE